MKAVLHATRVWALEHPNAYRLIFQTSIGSGRDFAADRSVPASSRSMAVIIEALAAVSRGNRSISATRPDVAEAPIVEVIRGWSDRAGLTEVPVEVLVLAFLSWTRLHGIISLELGGHLEATGVGAAVLFEAEVGEIRSRAAQLTPGDQKTG